MEEVVGEFEKWNELPPELKQACIKRMGLCSRGKLRGTSTTERDLVDDMKFEHLFMNICEEGVVIEEYNGIVYWFNFCSSKPEYSAKEPVPKYSRLLEQIFKRDTIQCVNITNNPFIARINFQELLGNVKKPIQIRELSTSEKNCERTALLLKKCWDQLETLTVNGGVIHIYKLYQNPQMNTTVRKIFHHVDAHDYILMLVDWCEKSEKIGTFCMFQFIQQRCLDSINPCLRDFIIYRDKSVIRFKTVNPETEVLLLTIKFHGMNYAECAVVPKGLPVTEFKKYTVHATRLGHTYFWFDMWLAYRDWPNSFTSSKQNLSKVNSEPSQMFTLLYRELPTFVFKSPLQGAHIFEMPLF